MDIRITRTTSPKPRPPENALGFGVHFSDHLFAMDYTEATGWTDARIEPYGPFLVDPAAVVFHYGQAMFEGTKAFRGVDGRIRLFRPEKHAERMARGAERLCMQVPTVEQMTEALRAFVRLEADWVPRAEGTSLYLRPTLIATEPFLGVRPAKAYRYFIIASPAGAYFGDGLKSVRIWVETKDVRAPRGGLGATKAGANYVASLRAAVRAKAEGYDQVLWTDAKEHAWVEEVGTMNVFFLLGGTLVTPPLSDSILGGITRDAVLILARELGIPVEERPVSLDEIRAASRAGKLEEVFGTGTAAVISPVGSLALEGEELVINDREPGPVARALYDAVVGIQRGTRPDPHGWVEILD